MANLVGLTINDSQAYRVMAASGTIIQAHYAPATITLANENEKYQWQTIVTVVEETWPEAIFGLPGFLDYFEIRLDGHSKHLELAPNQGCPHS